MRARLPALFFAALAIGSGAAQEPSPPLPESSDSVPQDQARDGAEPAVNSTLQRATMLPPEQRQGPRFDRRWSVQEIQDSLRELFRLHPEMVRLDSIGRSAGGHEITVATLTDPASGAAGSKPGVFVVGSRGPNGSGTESGFERDADAEAALGLAWAAVSGEDQELGELLGRATLYVAPLLDPDGRDASLRGEGERRAVAGFDQSFPCGWLPEAQRAGSDRIPLARSETRAVARFLNERVNLVLVTGRFPEPDALAEPLFEIPREDRRVFAALAAAAPGGFAGWRVPSLPSGNLFDYAYFAQGSLPVGWSASLPPAAEEGGEVFEARVLELIERTGALARRLPWLSLELSTPERLAGGLWSLDLRVANLGALPTDSALSASRRSDRTLQLSVQGARVLATALREPGVETFRLSGGDASGPERSIGGLGAERERWVRLILEVPAGAEVAIQVDGAWVSAVDATLSLP